MTEKHGHGDKPVVMDTIRVLRLVEFVGPRDAVEEQLKNSLHGSRDGSLGPKSKQHCRITSMTIGIVPETLEGTGMTSFEKAMKEDVDPPKKR